METIHLRITDVGCQAEPAYRLHLHVGVQSFPVSNSFESLEHIQWYATMLRNALAKGGCQYIHIVNDDWEVLPAMQDYPNPWTTADDQPSLFDDVD